MKKLVKQTFYNINVHRTSFIITKKNKDYKNLHNGTPGLFIRRENKRYHGNGFNVPLHKKN